MQNMFDCFVVFAEMRTGSNFLESNLNAIEGLSCHGEAFNPFFIAYPNETQLLGVTQAMRDADPDRLLTAIRQQDGQMGGFRFFHDHDPRVLDTVLQDPRCAKIILTRNPLDSYVSWKIAQATGQWKLTNVKNRKQAKAVFDGPEFARHVEVLQDFQTLLLNQLQRSGQTPFYLAYEDLQDVDVMNGLARWLGVSGTLDTLDKNLKRQNPNSMTTKVANLDDMVQALAGLDRFNLTRTPNFEPRRGPAVPTYVVSATAPLVYMPIRGGPETEVMHWMADLDGVDPDALRSKLNQKELRQWKRKHPGHRSFTVVRHPVLRAHAAFCDRILTTGPGGYAQIREALRKQFKLPIPKEEPGPSYSRSDHRQGFEAFLKFVGANLSGQTGIRVDAAWCTQSQALSGFGDFLLPDLVLREDELATVLPDLAARLGCRNIPRPPKAAHHQPYALADIYDEALEAQVADVYQRDYMMFGFEAWSAG